MNSANRTTVFHGEEDRSEFWRDIELAMPIGNMNVKFYSGENRRVSVTFFSQSKRVRGTLQEFWTKMDAYYLYDPLF